MYRLDYLNLDGKTTGGVQGRHIGILPTDQVLTQHMATARVHAKLAALRAECDVLITRIGKAGQLRATLVIHPDGSASPPPQAKTDPRSTCVRREGKTCFCPTCRAERREQRRV
jgi:hypothetical protein